MKPPLHTKDLGALGEITVAQYLIRRGLPVFVEYGDNSRVDIITIYKDQLVKIQVKAYNVQKHTESVLLSAKKSGPNYKYTYRVSDFDVFALYVPKYNKVLFIPLRLVLNQSGKSVTIRLKKAKQNQKARIRMADDYASFNKAVKYAQGKNITYKIGKPKERTTKVRKFVQSSDIMTFERHRKNGKTGEEAAKLVGFHHITMLRAIRQRKQFAS